MNTQSQSKSRSNLFITTENRIARVALILPKLKISQAKKLEKVLDRVYRKYYSNQAGAGRESESFFESFDESELEAEIESDRQRDDQMLAKLEAELKTKHEAELDSIIDEFLLECDKCDQLCTKAQVGPLLFMSTEAKINAALPLVRKKITDCNTCIECAQECTGPNCPDLKKLVSNRNANIKTQHLLINHKRKLKDYKKLQNKNVI